MYEIELADGTKIPGLELNGNTFTASGELDAKIFSHNLSKVKITSDNLPPEDLKPEEGIQPSINKGVEYDDMSVCGEFHNMELASFRIRDNKVWFVIREIEAKRLESMRQRAQLEYLAMMTDVDLDDLGE